jgi:hypothetical protein
MWRKIILAGLIGILVAGAALPVVAQANPDAGVLYKLHMRTGPDRTFASITKLDIQTGLVLEARNADTSCVLGHTIDGVFRGWVSALYLNYRDGFSPAGLPVSTEIVAVAPSPLPEDNSPLIETAPSSGLRAIAESTLNVRSGPGTSYSVIGKLAPGEGLVLEARNASATWVLGHTSTLRGWVSSSYVQYQGSSPAALPISQEILNASPAISNVPTTSSARQTYTLPVVSGIDLHSYPIVPTATNLAISVYARGRARGNNPHVVAKVGDCGTDHPYFLSSFYWGPYDLGQYGYLQGVVDYFGESLAYTSQAAAAGFVADAVIDPQWANPNVCQPNESALQCEYRIHKPSVALIMFGLTDLQRRTPQQFYSDLRVVVDQSIDAGVIPILSTFPPHQAFPQESILYNQIVIQVAQDYNAPLINLWLALDPLPNHGMMDDGTHMTGYAVGGAGFLLDQNLQMGYVMRNLVTLQALDVIWRTVMS